MSALLAVFPHQRTCLPQSVLSSQLNASMGYARVSYLLLVQSCSVWEQGTAGLGSGSCHPRARPPCADLSSFWGRRQQVLCCWVQWLCENLLVRPSPGPSTCSSFFPDLFPVCSGPVLLLYFGMSGSSCYLLLCFHSLLVPLPTFAMLNPLP